VTARTLLAAWLLLALAMPATGDGGRGAETANQRPLPRDLPELSRRLDTLAARIRKLRHEAERDPEDALILCYERYTHEDFKQRRRDVRPHQLVGFMADTAMRMETRRHAFTALREGPLRGDPELSRYGKQGRMRQRAYFATKHVVPLLRSEDRDNRQFADRLLKKWWVVSLIPAITAYHADRSKTWKPAADAWKKELRKR